MVLPSADRPDLGQRPAKMTVWGRTWRCVDSISGISSAPPRKWAARSHTTSLPTSRPSNWPAVRRFAAWNSRFLPIGTGWTDSPTSTHDVCSSPTTARSGNRRRPKATETGTAARAKGCSSPDRSWAFDGARTARAAGRTYTYAHSCFPQYRTHPVLYLCHRGVRAVRKAERLVTAATARHRRLTADG